MSDVPQSEVDPVVCVIDDDADVREGLQALLASVGLRSSGFGSTSEFLKSQSSSKPNCLILDVRLPGLSGLDFQAKLSAANVSIPIVMITGHADVPMSVKAMKAGAIEFLTKPFRDQDLLDAVRTAFERDRLKRLTEAKAHDLRTRFAALTAREQKAMELVTAGLLNKQAAAQMGISEVTVKVHRHNIMKKFGTRSLADLVRIADALGLPDPKAGSDAARQ